MATQPSSSGQGAVKHPETDQRLKENQGGQRSSGRTDDDDSDMSENSGRKTGRTGGSDTPARDEDGKFTSDDSQSNRDKDRRKSENG
jgi:hypothetical protein